MGKTRDLKKITDEQTGVIEIVIASNTNCIYKASKKAFFFSVIISHCQFPLWLFQNFSHSSDFLTQDLFY